MAQGSTRAQRFFTTEAALPRGLLASGAPPRLYLRPLGLFIAPPGDGYRRLAGSALAFAQCEVLLEKNNLRKKIVVDCSHDNSNKDHRLQPKVLADCIEQIVEGNRSIVGFMIESNLFEGNQPIPPDLKQLKYGVSVTDKCIDWPMTEKIILEAYERLNAHR